MRCREDWPDHVQGVYRGVEDALEIVAEIEAKIKPDAYEAHIALGWVADRLLSMMACIYDDAERERRRRRDEGN
jgi:hypothetical protein